MESSNEGNVFQFFLSSLDPTPLSDNINWFQSSLTKTLQQREARIGETRRAFRELQSLGGEEHALLRGELEKLGKKQQDYLKKAEKNRGLVERAEVEIAEFQQTRTGLSQEQERLKGSRQKTQQLLFRIKEEALIREELIKGQQALNQPELRCYQKYLGLTLEADTFSSGVSSSGASSSGVSSSGGDGGEKGEGIKFTFTLIDPNQPERPFYFILDRNAAKVLRCEPPLPSPGQVQRLEEKLGKDGDFAAFLVNMRRAFSCFFPSPPSTSASPSPVSASVSGPVAETFTLATTAVVQ